MANTDVSEVAKRLKRLREQAGISIREMTRLTGKSYQHYEDRYKKDELPADLARVVANALIQTGKVDPFEAGSLLPNIEIPADYPEKRRTPPVPRNIAKTEIADTFTPGRRDLPVRGHASGGESGHFEQNGEIIDYTFRPEALQGVQGAYALYMSGVSMEPRYTEGETLFIHPNKPLRPGEYAVYQVADDNNETPLAYVKQYVRKDGKKYVFQQFNPAQEITISADKLISLHKIILAGDP